MTVTRRDDRQEIHDENRLIGYIENDILYGIDKDGYAVEVGSIEHIADALEMLRAWRDQSA